MLVSLAAGLGQGFRSEAALIRDRWLGGALRERGVPVTTLYQSTVTGRGAVGGVMALPCLSRGER